MSHVNRGIFDDYYESTLQWYRPPGWVDDRPPARSKPGSKSSNRSRLRRAVYPRDGFKCRDCPVEFPKEESYDGHPIDGLTLGHIIPKSKGGGWTIDNLIAQCSRCNQKLRDRIWVPGWRSGV